MPAVSFVIPVYNCRAYLRSAAEQAAAVWPEHSEILLIDDGSSDGSGALCDLLAREIPAVRAIHQRNAGASAARNRGLEEAAGELIVFLDADDGVESAPLRAILEQMAADPGLDLALFGMSFEYRHL